MRYKPLIVLLVLLTCFPNKSRSLMCVGDCDENGTVQISELILGVRIALNLGQLDNCRSFDANRDEIIAVNELLLAVNAALRGCQPSAFPTPTPFNTTILGQLLTTTKVRVPTVLSTQDKEAITLILESRGYTWDPEKSAFWRESEPAVGWLIRIDGQTVRVDRTGVFSLEISSGRGEIELFHPADPTDVIAAIPVGVFTLDGSSALQINIELTTYASCGMNATDFTGSLDVCPRSTPGSGSERQAVRDTEADLSTETSSLSVTCDPSLGTCPSGLTQSCLDYDGPLCSVSIPADPPPPCHECDACAPTTSELLKNFKNYQGSTCQHRVDEQCCTNEFASWQLVILDIVFPIEQPRVKRCAENHNGRICQELRKNELVLRTPFGIIREGDMRRAVFRVEPGEAIEILVHNNACFGYTYIRRSQGGLGGVLESMNLTGSILDHNRSKVFGAYSTDASVVYRAPLRCTGGVDEFVFEADEASLGVAFECVQPTATATPDSTPTLPPLDECGNGYRDPGEECDNASDSECGPGEYCDDCCNCLDTNTNSNCNANQSAR